MKKRRLSIFFIIISFVILFTANVPAPPANICSDEELLQGSNWAIEGWVSEINYGESYDSGRCIDDPEDSNDVLELIRNCTATLKITKVLKGDLEVGNEIEIYYKELVQEGTGNCMLSVTKTSTVNLYSTIRYYHGTDCHNEIEEIIEPGPEPDTDSTDDESFSYKGYGTITLNSYCMMDCVFPCFSPDDAEEIYVLSSCGDYNYLFNEKIFTENDRVYVEGIVTNKTCSISEDYWYYEISVEFMDYENSYKNNLSTPSTNLSVLLTTDKTIYKKGEIINSTINVTNNGINNESISPIPYFEVLNNTGKQVYLDPTPFITDAMPILLNPGESKNLYVSWNQKDNNDTFVSSGNYSIRTWLANGQYSNSIIIRIEPEKTEEELKDNNTTKTEDKKTPGFELILVVCSIIIFLFWKKKKSE